MYDVILADPPWYYRNNLKNIPSMGGYSYDFLSDEKLISLPVGELAAKDSVLFLWATAPKLPEAIQTMYAWGFKYKTVAFVWVKLNKRGRQEKLDRGDIILERGVYSGLGYYTNGNVELCLLGRRGKGFRRLNKSVKQLLFAPVQEHSKKPEEIYKRINLLCGDRTRKLELFARRYSDYNVYGFDQTGLEFDGLSIEEFIRGKCNKESCSGVYS